MTLLSIFNCNYESLVFKPQVNFNLGITKQNNNTNTFFNFIIDSKFPDYHTVFSDASKHDENNCVGVGVYHKQYEIVQKIKLPAECTVFSGECLGIFKAVEYILLLKLSKTLIFTDSLSALQAINNCSFKKIQHPLIYEIKKLLYRCHKCHYDVQLNWIPGHAGIYGNVRADELAKEAVFSGDIFPFKIYTPDLKSMSKQSLQISWQDLWDESSTHKGSHYHKIQPYIPSKPWFFSTHFSRKVTSVIIRLRLGHTCSPIHLYKLKIIETPECICGAEIADENHIFLSCPLYNRDTLFDSLVSFHIPLPVSMNYLLYTNNMKVYKLLTDFIVKNSIQI